MEVCGGGVLYSVPRGEGFFFFSQWSIGFEERGFLRMPVAFDTVGFDLFPSCRLSDEFVFFLSKRCSQLVVFSRRLIL
jgi:hypothetical protein